MPVKAKQKAAEPVAATQPAPEKSAPATGIQFEGLGNIVDSASKIVLKAANILEEEIARGIVAAKQIEGKLTDVQKLRGGNKEELLTRFRQDAHDVIDLLIDFTTIAVKNAGSLASRIINIRQGGTDGTDGSPQAEDPVQIPLIHAPKDMKAGEALEVPITLENDSKTDVKTIEFTNTALMDASNNQIAAAAITYTPNPLVLQPGSNGSVKIAIKVPDGAKPGSYTCFIQGKNVSNLKATLLVKVV
ncbi:hypothetical protein [Chitinophaga barathri]|uniref:Uncharacterized protein n=1 Tax=Chitinophaga barathri TaxID=1647451 RepID=A0A3N4M5N7_9BACT|nr:hypothetical protein [Chitinophaga barathri]RPD38315.1 hypothetical protein EG028_25855 [Chitinophaga barathri]